MEATVGSTNKYESGQSGVLGLGPYTANDGKFEDFNFMKAIKDKKIIDHNVVSYNISFPKTGEMWKDESYIYLGQISDLVTMQSNFINSTDNEAFKPKLTDAFMFDSGNLKGKMRKFGPTFVKKAVFDL